MKAVASDALKIKLNHMRRTDYELSHVSDYYYPEIKPHIHDFYEIFYFVGGNICYCVEDRFFDLQNGDILIVPPQVIHHPVFKNFEQPYERYILWVSKCEIDKILMQEEKLRLFFEQQTTLKFYLYRPARSDYNLLALFLNQAEILYSSQPEFWEIEFQSFLTFIVTSFCRQVKKQGEQKPPTGEQSLIADLLTYIHHEINHEISLDSLSAAFCKSKHYISHVFTSYCGISIYQYILKQRLLLAKECILKGVPLQEVAINSGFKDYSNFYRAFIKEFKVKPTEFKDNRLKKQ